MRGLYAADGHIQSVAGNGAVVIGCHRVDLEGLVQHGGIHLHLHGRPAGCLRHFHAVGVPADGAGVQILAAQLCTEGVGVAQNSLAVAADLDGCLREHGSHIQILLEVGVGAGLFCPAVALLMMAFPVSGS